MDALRKLKGNFGKSHEAQQKIEFAPNPNTNPNNYTISSFEIKRTLGTGSFGRVHLVKLKGSEDYFAMKVLKKSEVMRLKQDVHTVNERDVLSVATHPFLIKMEATMQDSMHLYFILEYVLGGELFSILRKARRFPNHVAKFYAAEVVLAIEYLHSMDVVYRDLKPENILIAKDGHIKITDFGFAKYVPDNITWTLCGTPDYLAPEIIQSRGYGKPADWYALGILIFEMLCGFPPFYNEDHVKIYEGILAGKIVFPSSMDSNAKDIIKSLISFDISKRLGNLKNGVADIKKHPWFKGVDWTKLAKKQITPPYVPPFKGYGDTSYFDRYPEENNQYGIQTFDPFQEKFANF